MAAEAEMKTTLDDCLALWQRGEVLLPEAALLRWLRRNRLLPLLGWRAEAEGWSLPEAIATAIRRDRRGVAVAQILADQQLAALGETAQHLGIPVVLVKGAAAAQAYPAPWMRPYGDIDLLVDEAALPQFVEALLAQGYVPTQWATGRQTRHFPPLIPPGQGTFVEVHAAMGREHGRVVFTLAQWEGGLQPAANYPGLWTPNVRDHVLYLIYHAVVHHDLAAGLLPYADVGFHTETWGEEDWQTLTEDAAALGMGRALGLGIALTTWFWQRDAPTTANFERPDTALMTLAQTIAAGTLPHRWVPHLWRDSPDFRPRGLLTYIRTTLLGDPAQLQGYTTAQRLRFHLLRPFKLIQNHGASMWRLLTGDPATRAAWRRQRDLQRWLRGEERSNV